MTYVRIKFAYLSLTSSVLANQMGSNWVELSGSVKNSMEVKLKICRCLVSGPRSPTPGTGAGIGLTILLDGIHDCSTLDITLWGTL